MKREDNYEKNELYSKRRDVILKGFLAAARPDIVLDIESSEQLQLKGVDMVLSVGGKKKYVDTVHDSNYLTKNFCLEWGKVSDGTPGKFHPKKAAKVITDDVFFCFWPSGDDDVRLLSMHRGDYQTIANWLNAFKTYEKTYTMPESHMLSYLVKIKDLDCLELPVKDAFEKWSITSIGKQTIDSAMRMV